MMDRLLPWHLNGTKGVVRVLCGWVLTTALNAATLAAFAAGITLGVRAAL